MLRARDRRPFGGDFRRGDYRSTLPSLLDITVQRGKPWKRYRSKHSKYFFSGASELSTKALSHFVKVPSEAPGEVLNNFVSVASEASTGAQNHLFSGEDGRKFPKKLLKAKELVSFEMEDDEQQRCTPETNCFQGPTLCSDSVVLSSSLVRNESGSPARQFATKSTPAVASFLNKAEKVAMNQSIYKQAATIVSVPSLYFSRISVMNGQNFFKFQHEKIVPFGMNGELREGSVEWVSKLHTEDNASADSSRAANNWSSVTPVQMSENASPDDNSLNRVMNEFITLLNDNDGADDVTAGETVKIINDDDNWTVAPALMQASGDQRASFFTDFY